MLLHSTRTVLVAIVWTILFHDSGKGANPHSIRLYRRESTIRDSIQRNKIGTIRQEVSNVETRSHGETSDNGIITGYDMVDGRDAVQKRQQKGYLSLETSSISKAKEKTNGAAYPEVLKHENSDNDPELVVQPHSKMPAGVALQRKNNIVPHSNADDDGAFRNRESNVSKPAKRDKMENVPVLNGISSKDTPKRAKAWNFTLARAETALTIVSSKPSQAISKNENPRLTTRGFENRRSANGTVSGKSSNEEKAALYNSSFVPESWQDREFDAGTAASLEEQSINDRNLPTPQSLEIPSFFSIGVHVDERKAIQKKLPTENTGTVASLEYQRINDLPTGQSLEIPSSFSIGEHVNERKATEKKLPTGNTGTSVSSRTSLSFSIGENMDEWAITQEKPFTENPGFSITELVDKSKSTLSRRRQDPTTAPYDQTIEAYEMKNYEIQKPQGNHDSAAFDYSMISKYPLESNDYQISPDPRQDSISTTPAHESLRKSSKRPFTDGKMFGDIGYETKLEDEDWKKMSLGCNLQSGPSSQSERLEKLSISSTKDSHNVRGDNQKLQETTDPSYKADDGEDTIVSTMNKTRKSNTGKTRINASNNNEPKAISKGMKIVGDWNKTEFRRSFDDVSGKIRGSADNLGSLTRVHGNDINTGLMVSLKDREAHKTFIGEKYVNDITAVYEKQREQMQVQEDKKYDEKVIPDRRAMEMDGSTLGQKDEAAMSRGNPLVNSTTFAWLLLKRENNLFDSITSENRGDGTRKMESSDGDQNSRDSRKIKISEDDHTHGSVVFPKVSMEPRSVQFLRASGTKSEALGHNDVPVGRRNSIPEIFQSTETSFGSSVVKVHPWDFASDGEENGDRNDQRRESLNLERETFQEESTKNIGESLQINDPSNVSSIPSTGDNIDGPEVHSRNQSYLRIKSVANWSDNSSASIEVKTERLPVAFINESQQRNNERLELESFIGQGNRIHESKIKRTISVVNHIESLDSNKTNSVVTRRDSRNNGNEVISNANSCEMCELAERRKEENGELNKFVLADRQRTRFGKMVSFISDTRTLESSLPSGIKSGNGNQVDPEVFNIDDSSVAEVGPRLGERRAERLVGENNRKLAVIQTRITNGQTDNDLIGTDGERSSKRGSSWQKIGTSHQRDVTTDDTFSWDSEELGSMPNPQIEKSFNIVESSTSADNDNLASAFTISPMTIDSYVRSVDRLSDHSEDLRSQEFVSNKWSGESKNVAKDARAKQMKKRFTNHDTSSFFNVGEVTSPYHDHKATAATKVDRLPDSVDPIDDNPETTQLWTAHYDSFGPTESSSGHQLPPRKVSTHSPTDPSFTPSSFSSNQPPTLKSFIAAFPYPNSINNSNNQHSQQTEKTAPVSLANQTNMDTWSTVPTNPRHVTTTRTPNETIQNNSTRLTATLNQWPVKHSAVVEGDLVLGGLMMVHEREDSVTCGPVMPQGGVQALEAMLYTLDWINGRDLVPGVKIGAHILDDCDKDTYGLEMAVDFIKGSISNIDGAEYHCNKTAVRKVISGVVGAASSVTSIQVANLLRLFRIPQVSFFSTSPELSNKMRFEYFTRTIPSDHYQVKAMVDIVLGMKWSYVSIIYEESNYGEKAYEELEKLLGEHQICIAVKEKLSKDSGVAEAYVYDKIVQKLLTKPRARGCIIFASDQEVAGVMRAVRRCNATGAFSWIGSDGWSARSLVSDGNEREMEGTLSVQPQANPVEGFEDYFLNLTVENNRRNPWFVEFWEDHFKCRYPNSSRTPYNNYTEECTTTERLTKENTAFEDQLQFVSDAVMAFAHAFRNMHSQLCHGKPGLCDAMKPTKGIELLNYLRTVKFNGLSGDVFHFDKNGDGPARYNIIHFKQISPGEYKWIRVGKYLEGELRLDMPEIQFRLGHPEAPESVCSLPCEVGQAKKYVEGESCCWHCFNCSQDEIRHVNDEKQCVPCPKGTLPDETHSYCRDIPEEFLRPESGWAIGAMSFSSTGILITLFVGGVFLKHNDTPIVRASGRELSYVLLTGILLCYLVTFALVLRPTDIVCSIQRFSAGFCFTVMYAALLTKTNRISRIFNAGKRSAKRPSFISPRSQLLICSMLVAVQILINAVWMVIDPAKARHHYPTREDNLLVCNSYIDASYMIAFTYPIILIVVCTVYAVLTRKIPEAFNESKHIGFTMYTTCVIWLAFVPLYFATGSHVALRITSMSVTISLSATVTIACLFTPKLYIILIHPERNVRPNMMHHRYNTTKGSVVTATNASSMMAPVTLTAVTCDQNKAVTKHAVTTTDCSTQSEQHEIEMKERINGKVPASVTTRSTQTSVNNNGTETLTEPSPVIKDIPIEESIVTAKALNIGKIGNGPLTQNEVPL